MYVSEIALKMILDDNLYIVIPQNVQLEQLFDQSLCIVFTNTWE